MSRNETAEYAHKHLRKAVERLCKTAGPIQALRVLNTYNKQLTEFVEQARHKLETGAGVYSAATQAETSDVESSQLPEEA